ncbi:hydroxyphenylacetyl-CoA thioesterase PaaI [soil metagenome]
MTSQEIAAAVADTMLGKDHASRSLGIECSAIGPGTATVTMTVCENMLNGFGSCHGGIVTTVADTAFGLACNSHNVWTVASGFDVNIVAPAYEGDVLTASANELSRAGRTGVYDITVRNQNDKLVAVFRGRSYSIKGKAVLLEVSA